MHKILIVEDDAVTAHLYRNHLENAGYEVQVAVDGQMAIDQIDQIVPDGLLVDLMMPRVNGIEVVKRVRAMPQYANIPIIAYTNAFIPKMVQDATAAGASRVFDKASVTPAMLIEAFKGK